MKQKRKTIVAVFAHPDDEAFGPAGTLAKFAQTHDVYVICATNGEAGDKTYAGMGKLGDIRRKELEASAKILGVKKVFFLGFKDGTLSNNLYHDLACSVERVLQKLKPDTLITFELRGVSGHIDHIVTAFVVTYVFERMPFIKKLMYFCVTAKFRKPMKSYFIHVPPGYDESEIDEAIDISTVFEKKIAAVQAHVSQKKDVLRILPVLQKFDKKEHFLVLKK
ncbi:MAG: hypothetical protein A2633_03485 [Candidatus Sungbacteria bacterium RIFCSPHIGHO2_01_FULL_47_32]|uniref:GlcNAc-PI de-N-acetylase n=1 Tax=Candidatus Sungbacteria bacterium RIFCSPHIGHO2_01_FULL_47_32 TaxID=1802264 RepID=A0A1G2K5M1_9BACT|nr:MAG: hypothetical protein A2633_03485 [Candidatus Sungbacteria bacterium RIFCSPHIGHO2_01_FULL_47_32]